LFKHLLRRDAKLTKLSFELLYGHLGMKSSDSSEALPKSTLHHGFHLVNKQFCPRGQICRVVITIIKLDNPQTTVWLLADYLRVKKPMSLLFD